MQQPTASARRRISLFSFLRRVPLPVYALLILTAVWRLLVLSSGQVAFHSDEAVVGLMAKHINEGRGIPTFFYGQPYMGSLDALLTSFIFRFTGPTVFGLRLTQMLLALATLAAAIGFAWRMAGAKIAILAGLLLAIPSVTLLLYTTVTLGGYGETLLIGTLLLLLAYELGYSEPKRPIRYWIAIGALAGLGWWTNNLIVAYLLPVGLMLLRRLRQDGFSAVGRAAAYFVVFSAPWWLYNLRNDWASVRFLLEGYSSDIATPVISIGDRFIGLLFIGLPGLLGVRFPWSPDYWPGNTPSLIIILLILVLLLFTLNRAFARRGPERFLWTMVGCFSAVFLASNFGLDSTGRYLVPLAIPLAVLLALHIGRFRLWLAVPTVVAFMTLNVIGTELAIRTNLTGLTTQVDPITDITNTYDAEVLAFLGERRGYGTYWVAYRLAFLSGERVQLSSTLPYKDSLVYFDNDRYRPYTEAALASPDPVYVTAKHPSLNRVLVERFARLGITFQRHDIGPYSIFYALSRPVSPVELGLAPAP